MDDARKPHFYDGVIAKKLFFEFFKTSFLNLSKKGINQSMISESF